MKVVNDAKVKLSELLLAVFVPEVNAKILQKTLLANMVSFTKYTHFFSLGFSLLGLTQEIGVKHTNFNATTTQCGNTMFNACFSNETTSESTTNID